MKGVRPLAVDLGTGLGGWADGLRAEGWFVIGVDIVDMFKLVGEPKPDDFALLLQDVRTIHGSQFRKASLITASMPCTEYSYMAMFDGRCGLTGAKIHVGDAYDFDHIKPLWAGGEHRESNLQPALKDRHREKSTEDQSRQSKADRTRFKHITPRADWPKTQQIRSATFRKRQWGEP